MLVRLAGLFCLCVSVACAQGLQCVALSGAPVIHAEGVTERVGDVSANCSGGSPNAVFSGNLNIFLSVNLTNRLNAGGFTDIRLTTDNGSGPVLANVSAQLAGVNQAVFNGLSFQLSPNGNVVLLIQNVRANASQARNTQIFMQLASNGSSLGSIFTSQFTVANPLPSFRGATNGALLCSSGGSALPDDPASFTGFIGARSAVSSFRISEGFPSAFSPKSDSSNFQADSGVRFLIRYSKYPGVARLFVPDVIVGTDGTNPTSAGDLGLAVSGGSYTAGSSGLLLARVIGADSNGGGGAPVITAPPASSGIVNYDGVSEIAVTPEGNAYAVYEVIAGDPFSRQSAQIPTFLALAPGAVNTTFETQEDIFIAAVSSAPTASSSAPVPRFVTATPLSDCEELGDCRAPYFPSLFVNVLQGLQFTIGVGSPSQSQYIPIENSGGGVLRWAASATYKEGSNWLRLAPASGFNNGTIRVDALPAGLPVGVYNATIRIDSGANGVVPLAVKLTVAAAAPPPAPVITSVTSTVSGQIRSIVAGSRALVSGTNLTGGNVLVALDGTPVAVLTSTATQMTILVPDSLAGKSTASLTVSVDGASAPPFNVNVADVAPAILPAGVLNLDYSVNSETKPAVAGSVFQVFATGLPANGTITGRVHDIDIFDPLYGGPAPGAIGIQQVNLQIHPLFPTMQTSIYVCGQVANGPRVCSAAVPIWLRQAP